MKQITFALLIALVSCNTEKKNELVTSEQKQETMELSNKEKAVALIASLQTGDLKGASYINQEKYIQHNLAVADGLSGFG